ncbi:MAG: flavodoxin family protein [Clostridia bacterium]|nr:flavodoxin family protein [Clostridia bacterium]
MKNVIIISSTPRVGGNSEVLSNEFARGAKDAGHNVEVIQLRDLNLKYCVGCYACHSTGKCIHNDGMNEISEKLLNADVIVFATPVYFYSMSGQLKVFIDRLVPHYTKISADIYLIATQWDAYEENMENTFNAIRGCTADCFENCQEKGVIYGVGLNNIGDAQKNQEYMSQAYTMGKNV